VNANDATAKAILALARSMGGLQQKAAQQYRPVVDDILRTGSRGARHIEHTLDRLLDFCDFEPVLEMYR
jgi:ABC-type branched-subunit amino acid transport system ATPase component